MGRKDWRYSSKTPHQSCGARPSCSWELQEQRVNSQQHLTNPSHGHGGMAASQERARRHEDSSGHMGRLAGQAKGPKSARENGSKETALSAEARDTNVRSVANVQQQKRRLVTADGQMTLAEGTVVTTGTVTATVHHEGHGWVYMVARVCGAGRGSLTIPLISRVSSVRFPILSRANFAETE